MYGFNVHHRIWILSCLGGVYQLSGFAHILMEIEPSAYRKAVQSGCGALHQISRAAHKPGLSHLYGAMESMEIRCKRLEQVANSQLRAMVCIILL